MKWKEIHQVSNQKLKNLRQCLIKGNGNKLINCEDCIIQGNENVIQGKNNMILGRKNSCGGEQNKIKGNKNTCFSIFSFIFGNNNICYGDHCTIQGEENESHGNFCTLFSSSFDNHDKIIEIQSKYKKCGILIPKLEIENLKNKISFEVPSSKPKENVDWYKERELDPTVEKSSLDLSIEEMERNEYMEESLFQIYSY